MIEIKNSDLVKTRSFYMIKSLNRNYQDTEQNLLVARQ